MPRPTLSALLVAAMAMTVSSRPAAADPDCDGLKDLYDRFGDAAIAVETARTTFAPRTDIRPALVSVRDAIDVADDALLAEAELSPSELAGPRASLHAKLAAAKKSVAKAARRADDRTFVKRRLAAAARSLRRALDGLGRVIDRAACGVRLDGPTGTLAVFPSDNWWNEDVSGRAVAADSDAVIDFIGRGKSLHADFGTTFGIPYVVLDGEQTLSPVTFLYDDESDHAAPGREPGYPIPGIAKTSAGFIEGFLPGGGRSGDRHMLLVDLTSNLLWELYALSWDGDSWSAGSGAIFDLTSNARRPDGWTSADAAGLAIFPGLVRKEEAVDLGEIRHALRFTVRATQGYVFPASHDATHGEGGAARPPLGLRVRLKADVDLSAMSAPGRAIFTAMKKYGLILADNGSDWFVTGAPDPRWDDDAIHADFARVTGNDFEVVE